MTQHDVLSELRVREIQAEGHPPRSATQFQTEALHPAQEIRRELAVDGQLVTLCGRLARDGFPRSFGIVRRRCFLEHPRCDNPGADSRRGGSLEDDLGAEEGYGKGDV